jgi:hypothetical protein
MSSRGEAHRGTCTAGVGTAGAGLLRLLTLVLAISLAMSLAPACADDDHHDKDQHGDKGRPTPALPAGGTGAATAYGQECGACHHAYYPGLLPARSWEKLLANPGDHFGEQLPLAGAALAEVRAYLAANAADVSGNKRSRKIMRSIGGGTPLRISEIGYLRDKHHELSAEVFKRPAVGGLANCIACHKGASAGDFDDDRAVIPK